MVNLTKRMSVFQPLLDLRHGKGAHILPPAPAPQLTHVYLRYPRRRGLTPDSRTDGANRFHKRYLPRLKYYNPTLNIDIKNDGNTNAIMKLTLQFEGTDPEALRAIARKSTRVKQARQQTEEELEAEAKKQSPNFRDAPSPGEPLQNQNPTADDDEVILKERPKSELGQEAGVPVYTRAVTLAVQNRPHWEIWKWFKKRTGAEPAPMTEEDKKLRNQINKDTERREVDREKGKIVSAQLRREREALEKAKKAADEAAAPAA